MSGTQDSGSGDNTATESSSNVIEGTSVKDRIIGSNDADEIYGGGGGDFISGEGGNDFIYGGAGDDTIIGGAGNDVLTGGAGFDTLLGGGGKDKFVFAPGDGGASIMDFTASDKIDLSDFGNISGISDLKISEGVNDHGGYVWIDVTDSIQIRLENFNINNLDESSFVFWNDGDDSIMGSDGNDTILGGAGNDILYGKDGVDTLHGGTGGDLIFGGAGNDTLIGGPGYDVLAGGSGNDQFVVGPDDGSAGGASIMDFEAGDRVDLSGFGSISSFSDLVISERTGDVPSVQIDLPGGAHIRLENFDIENLDESDFIFAGDSDAFYGG